MWEAEKAAVRIEKNSVFLSFEENLKKGKTV